ncbi:hypothetical protein [Roseinatronobacter monicus]|nr:hypothetical protein [Roseinatronobacter monicus]
MSANTAKAPIRLSLVFLSRFIWQSAIRHTILLGNNEGMMQQSPLNALESPQAVPAPLERELVLLRVLMRKCRAKARVEVFETCALLLHAPKEGAQDYADALLRVLVSGLPTGPVIHAITAQERSFDEKWLLALFAAIQRKDQSSVAFLLRTRLPLHMRRPVGWLATELLNRMDSVPDKFHQV